METKEKLMKMGVVFLGVLSLLAVVMIFSEVRSYRFIGSANGRVATIVVNGQAKKSVVPDIAKMSFGVMVESKDVKTAQAEATKKNNAIIDYLKKAGVAEKDIKSSASINPRYGNRNLTVLCQGCEPNQEIIGYSVGYQMEIVIRDLAKAGDLIAGVSGLGVSNLNGPYFIVENEEQHKADIRAEAIADAEAKAERLADDLGVKIVRVIDFNEAGGPIYYGKAMMAEAGGMGGDSIVPQILPGENEVVSSVSITYEIR